MPSIPLRIRCQVILIPLNTTLGLHRPKAECTTLATHTRITHCHRHITPRRQLGQEGDILGGTAVVTLRADTSTGRRMGTGKKSRGDMGTEDRHLPRREVSQLRRLDQLQPLDRVITHISTIMPTRDRLDIQIRTPTVSPLLPVRAHMGLR